MTKRSVRGRGLATPAPSPFSAVSPSRVSRRSTSGPGSPGPTGSRCSANAVTTARTTVCIASFIAVLASSVANMSRSSSATPAIAAAAIASNVPPSRIAAAGSFACSGGTSATIAAAAAASASTGVGAPIIGSGADRDSSDRFAAARKSADVIFASSPPMRSPGRQPVATAAASSLARWRSLRGFWRSAFFPAFPGGTPRWRQPAHSWHCAQRGFSPRRRARIAQARARRVKQRTRVAETQPHASPMIDARSSAPATRRRLARERSLAFAKTRLQLRFLSPKRQSVAPPPRHPCLRQIRNSPAQTRARVPPRPRSRSNRSRALGSRRRSRRGRRAACLLARRGAPRIPSNTFS